MIDEAGLARPLRLCDQRGGAVGGDWRWLGAADSDDERLLDRAVGPVLDVGCGPGRHLLALARRGVEATGIDVTPAAVRLARSRGARVVDGSIFGPVLAPGTWATALLLDGNIGIGGDPVALLARVATVLRPYGRILVELGDPGVVSGSILVRIEHGVVVGPWFEWTTVDTGAIGVIAAEVGLTLTTSWSAGCRRFAQLDLGRPAAPVTPIDKVRASAFTIPPTVPGPTATGPATRRPSSWPRPRPLTPDTRSLGYSHPGGRGHRPGVPDAPPECVGIEATPWLPPASRGRRRP